MSYLYAQGTCKGVNGTTYTIKIIHDVAGTDLDTTFSLDASGFVMDYGGENDMYLVPGIVHSTCTINMLFQSDEFSALNTLVSDIVDAEDGEFLLRVDSGVMNWIGVILPEHLRITEESAIRELRIKATDGLSLLKTVDYNNNGTAYTSYQTVYEILQNIQEKTATYSYTDSVLSANVRLAWAEDVVSTDDYTYTTHPPTTSFTGIKRARINAANWIEYDQSGANYVSAYDVLVSLCNTFQWQLYAHAGGWWLLPIAVKDTVIYGNVLLYNGSETQTGIAGQYDYQTATKQKLPDWTIGYSPTVRRCKIQRRTKPSPFIFRAINFADGTTLSNFYYEFEGQDTASDTEFIRISGKAFIENTATPGLSNSGRVARIVLRCEIKWDDGVDAEWYANGLLVESSGAVATWFLETLGINVQNDLAVITVLEGAASSSSAYFYFHVEDEQYLYDAGEAGSRFASWEFDIPLPTTAKTGLSITPEILIYDKNAAYNATFTAATTVTWQRFGAVSYASDDETRLLTNFDIVAETTTGKGEIDLGFTHIGHLASETGRIDVQTSAGVYGSSEAWVNNSSSTERQINKLLVEEVLALNKKSAYVERGTVYIQNGSLPFPYLRYYDNDNGRYYTALTWTWNAGEALLDLTLRNIGRNFEYITSDTSGGTRNPFLDNVLTSQSTKPGNVMHGYNAESEAIFNAWTSGTIIGAGTTLEAYYTVTLNGNGKYVDFQGDTPASGYTIERVIYVKSDGLADHTSTSGWSSPAGLQPTAATSAGPTLQECWQAINGYLTKFSGSHNNFTFVISYDETSNAFTGLLDDYPGAAAAYSLRLLDTTYNQSAIRVRRASDNHEQNIGFDGNDLDITALATFCAGTNGFVKTWYDQSGNARNAMQATTSAQPKVYDSSTGVELENGKPTAYWTSASMNLIATPASPISQPYTIFAVAANDDYQSLAGVADVQSGMWLGTHYISGGINVVRFGTELFGAASTPNQSIYYGLGNGVNSEVGVNGITEATGNAGSADITRFGIGVSFGYLGAIQEVIFYSSDQSTNRAAIETNINDAYSIYGQTPTGLLADYPGAAAAYSLRQLISTAGYAIAVRRDSDNAVRPIGFVNGDLDTTTLASFCSGANGFVAVWYDQSGNSNDATQATTASQPKVYDSVTGVVTNSNDNISLYFDTGRAFTNITSAISTSHSSFVTAEGTQDRRQIYGFGGALAYQHFEFNFWNLNLSTTFIGDGSTYTTHTSAAITNSSTHLLSQFYDAIDYENFIDSTIDVSESETKTSSAALSIGARSNAPMYLTELVIYSSDQSANRTAIETNINDYYSIY